MVIMSRLLLINGICQQTLRLEMLPKVSEKGRREGEYRGEKGRKKPAIINNAVTSDLFENNTSFLPMYSTRVDKCLYLNVKSIKMTSHVKLPLERESNSSSYNT